ncbi:hypothetical protein U1Q18_027870 [Sarracenia purpurea var. burkii]
MVEILKNRREECLLKKRRDLSNSRLPLMYLSSKRSNLCLLVLLCFGVSSFCLPGSRLIVSVCSNSLALSSGGYLAFFGLLLSHFLGLWSVVAALVVAFVCSSSGYWFAVAQSSSGFILLVPFAIGFVVGCVGNANWVPSLVTLS